MRLPLAGGCQCGQMRYEVTAAPLAVYACYCTQCQRQSGGAFGLSMPCARDAVRLTAGTPANWSRPAAGGRTVVCRFCGTCGTRLFHESNRNTAIVTVKPGTLDDTSWLRPIAHIWTGNAQPWVRELHHHLVYEGQVPDFAEIHDAWSDRASNHDPIKLTGSCSR